MKTKNLFLLSVAMLVITACYSDSVPTEVDTMTQVTGNAPVLVPLPLAHSSNSRTRTGSRIWVNVNEIEACVDERLYTAVSPMLVADCEALLQDLTFELVASSELGGVLTYYYQGEPILRLGYDANSEPGDSDFRGARPFTLIPATTDLDNLVATSLVLVDSGQCFESLLTDESSAAVLTPSMALCR